ncbi:unnamed protein product [Sphenostylis stenocarpa]|uniref:Uncharacterized protein n=1 Tax=Sphenostylis stenocarpa TaxID=92480 RepID=A0AA86SN32_9FABA|nr:unnamed protein product [Sphenostylis stenocarpa]
MPEIIINLVSFSKIDETSLMMLPYEEAKQIGNFSCSHLKESVDGDMSVMGKKGLELCKSERKLYMAKEPCEAFDVCTDKPRSEGGTLRRRSHTQTLWPCQASL